MIVQGKITRILETDFNAIIEIEIPKYQAFQYDKEKLYSINIKEAKSKKSLNQNNFSWAVMTEIAKKNDIFPDNFAVYLEVLRLAKIKTHILQIENKPEIIEVIQRNFRALKILDEYVNAKGNEVATIEVAEGMSKFNKEEMTNFIDRLLYFAELNGVNTQEMLHKYGL